MKITIYGDNSPYILEYPNPILLSTLFAHEGVPLIMPCGGQRRCRKCKVVVYGVVSPITADEAALLDESEIRRGVRYACMTTVYGDTEVTLPKGESGARILTTGTLHGFKPDPWARGFGAAFDIGTTTVAAYLYDLNSGLLLATASAKNPQSVFGADVISRITRSLEGESAALASAMTGCVDNLILELCGKASVDPIKLSALVLTGNTAMCYLLMGLDPSSIAAAPFIQDHYFGEYFNTDGFIKNAPNARVYITRCISAYVGGDITAGILSSGLTDMKKPAILADIGTNGEIALYTGERLYCCSTAAGPAFEGAGIYMGQTATDGAISRVSVRDGTVTYECIGGGMPTGICGSGVIDAVAAFLRLGYIDETGSISDMVPYEMLTEADGVPAFKFPGCGVVLSGKDIRAVQLAKSAICSGIETLIETAGLSKDDIDRLFIAGGFGTILDIGSAGDIGLIPKGLSERAEAIGNAAGMGAVMMLLSRGMIEQSERIAREALTVELSTSEVFMNAYIENMMFPEQAE